ncbi:hypothetical protein Csa_009133, partial [Cucumis sativus]
EVIAQYASLVHTSLLNYGFTPKMNPSYWRYDMVQSRPFPPRRFSTLDSCLSSREITFKTISLSFGALGVNDVFAAVVYVLLTNRPKVTFPIAVLNNFKMGFACGLFIDAFKLA